MPLLNVIFLKNRELTDGLPTKTAKTMGFKVWVSILLYHFLEMQSSESVLAKSTFLYHRMRVLLNS